MSHREADRVPLEFVCATAWLDGRHHEVHDPASAATDAELRAAAERGVAWLELGLPNEVEAATEWFEGSLDVWERGPTPVVEWGHLEPVLANLGLTLPEEGPAGEGPADLRLLRVLPHVYARGIYRALNDVLVSAELTSKALLFPSVGFRPKEGQEEGSSLPHFWTIRANIGVVKNLVISIRVPDLLCTGVRGGGSYRSGARVLMIPQRFLPSQQPGASDIAGAIAHHQAATARAVTEPLRDWLRDIEREFTADEQEDEETQSAGRQDLRRSEQIKQLLPKEADELLDTADAAASIIEINEIVYQLDRQVSRLLRRFGSYGESAGGDEEPVPREVKLRYRFALDELHSLREDCRLVAELVRTRTGARERNERERFQFVAALLGTAILMPTLVAGVYGANVDLPGPRSTGFIALALFVVGCAVLGLFVVNEVWVRRWIPSGIWLERPGFRLIGLASAGIALAAGLLYLLIA